MCSAWWRECRWTIGNTYYTIGNTYYYNCVYRKIDSGRVYEEHNDFSTNIYSLTKEILQLKHEIVVRPISSSVVFVFVDKPPPANENPPFPLPSSILHFIRHCYSWNSCLPLSLPPVLSFLFQEIIVHSLEVELRLSLGWVSGCATRMGMWFIKGSLPRYTPTRIELNATIPYIIPAAPCKLKTARLSLKRMKNELLVSGIHQKILLSLVLVLCCILKITFVTTWVLVCNVSEALNCLLRPLVLVVLFEPGVVSSYIQMIQCKIRYTTHNIYRSEAS